MTITQIIHHLTPHPHRMHNTTEQYTSKYYTCTHIHLLPQTIRPCICHITHNDNTATTPRHQRDINATSTRHQRDNNDTPQNITHVHTYISYHKPIRPCICHITHNKNNDNNNNNHRYMTHTYTKFCAKGEFPTNTNSIYLPLPPYFPLKHNKRSVSKK